MGGRTIPTFGDERLQRVYEGALAYASRPELRRFVGEGAWRPELWAAARHDPGAFLSTHDAPVPDGLTVDMLDFPRIGMPTPDFETFTVALSDCRAFWVRKPDGKGFERVEVCRRIEIVPKPIPGGPLG